jgi:Zn-dependent peptidase ImmA (M78 family)
LSAYAELRIPFLSGGREALFCRASSFPSIPDVPAAKTKLSTANPMKVLRSRLSEAGVKRGFLNNVVLPSWWEDSIAATSGGFREAASYIAARLGFSLASLLDDQAALSYAHPSAVKYKKAKGVTAEDVSLATHYAVGAARSVAAALAEAAEVSVVPAPEEWRQALQKISDKPWVCLRHILKSSWELGIPVIHLKNLPAGIKKPDALTTMVGERPVIVVMSGRKSPSWIAFIVAHELGHIHHKHLKAGQTLVDEKINHASDEKEESQANDFAVRLLTGRPDLGLSSTRSMGIPQLATAAATFGQSYRIAPGVAALNYGFTTGEWPLAIGALSLLEKNDDAAKDLDKAMKEHLDLDALSDDSREWITRATQAEG